ncbi:hypothetical protein BG011_001204 [Mortierella polycephala]|uniref:Uncharacterized protein n=1 Tax=Mortierella polycephala TaxID=41804 RepID=A0A9P6UAW6_9FUNG|nr:hypothetical protein BG011_001204 [Mortierella polycephala]
MYHELSIMLSSANDRKQFVSTGGARRKASQSTTSTSSANLELGSKSQTTETYAPVNNFNTQDVINHFDRSWKAALDSFHQPNPSNPAKSEMYKGTETMAWANKVAPKGAMSTGADFLAELKRKQATSP